MTSVTADVSAVASGHAAVPLAAGTYTVEGVAYGYASGPVTADATLLPGSYGYSLALSDAAGNATVQGGFAVLVDAAPPAGADVQTANGGSVVGRAEAGDTITFTYTERIDPASILAGWTGGPTTVTVRLLGNAGGDRVQVWDAANTLQLPFGSVDLGRTDYTRNNRRFSGSTMVQAGSSVTITLGTPSGAVTTAAGAGTMTWTPSSAAYDAAGNPCLTTPAIESGPADREF